MDNAEKYMKLFEETFGISGEDAEELEYQGIAAWDSVGHMNLISAIEKAFDIMMLTDDIIELSSFRKGKEILAANYGVTF